MNVPRLRVAGALLIAALMWVPSLQFLFTPAAASYAGAGDVAPVLLLAAGLRRLKR